MPINPNIALGAQLPAPVNLLGQMGQMLALKAAAQDTEGYEGVKGAITGGMSPTDPRMLQFGKRGIDAYKAAGEGSVKQQDALSKAYTNSRQALSLVRSPEDLLTYSISQFSDPLIGPSLRARGLTPETVAANLQKEIATSGFENVLKKSAMGLDGWFKDQTSRRNTDVSSGPGYLNARLAREKFNLEQQRERTIQDVLSGGGATNALAPQAAPMGGGGGGAPVATAGTAPANALAPQPNAAPASANALAPQPSVPAEVAQLDSQIGQLIRVGTPQALNAVNALVARRNILMPTQQLVQDATGKYNLVDQRAGVSTPVVGADGKPLQGKVTPLPYESTYSQKVGSAAGDRDVALFQNAEASVDKLATINDTLAQLKSSDAITGFGADFLKDVERFRAQFMGDAKAGKRASDTEILNAMLGSEVFGMIQSLGIGARGLDTPAEREYLREVMTGTVRMDKAALIRLTEIRQKVTERAIDKYNEKVKKGDLDKFFQTQGISPRIIEKPVAPVAPAAASAEAPPPGLSPEIAGLWQYMTPEDRKLWQK
jgi:hypothetical protein